MISLEEALDGGDAVAARRAACWALAQVRARQGRPRPDMCQRHLHRAMPAVQNAWRPPSIQKPGMGSACRAQRDRPLSMCAQAWRSSKSLPASARGLSVSWHSEAGEPLLPTCTPRSAPLLSEDIEELYGAPQRRPRRRRAGPPPWSRTGSHAAQRQLLWRRGVCPLRG